MGEHQVDADGPERLAHVGVRQAHRIGFFGEHLGGNVVDVVAGITVVGRRLVLRRRDQRVGEPIDLGAVVVEVVLADDIGALSRQQATQRIADSGPAGAADVDRVRWDWRRRTPG